MFSLLKVSRNGVQVHLEITDDSLPVGIGIGQLLSKVTSCFNNQGNPGREEPVKAIRRFRRFRIPSFNKSAALILLTDLLHRDEVKAHLVRKEFNAFAYVNGILDPLVWLTSNNDAPHLLT